METATAKIDNNWIDFVNLRCEEYSEDSRIPVMVFILSYCRNLGARFKMQREEISPSTVCSIILIQHRLKIVQAKD